MKRVLKLKLHTDKHTYVQLLQVTRIYSQACNALSREAFASHTFARFDLHKLAYYRIRTEFALPSQLAIRAIAEVASAYKALTAQIKEHNKICAPQDRRELTQITFGENMAVAFDERVLLLDTDQSQVALRLLEGRVSLPFQAGEKRKHLLV